MCMGETHLLEHSGFSKAIYLKKTDSSFLSLYLLPIAAQLEVGLSDHPPTQVEILSVLMLSRSCAYSHSHCGFTWAIVLLYLGNTVFFAYGSSNLSAPTLMIHEPWEEKVWYRHPILGWVLFFSVPWLIVGLCVSCHLLQKELLWWG